MLALCLILIFIVYSYIQSDILYSTHFGTGNLTTATAAATSSIINGAANHGAAFNHLQHLRHNNNEREIEDEETVFTANSCSNTPQKPPRKRYQGKKTFCVHLNPNNQIRIN